MLFETRTSVYRLEQKKDKGFKVTKVAMKAGKTSSVDVGRSFEGDSVVINESGLHIGSMKTSSVILPIAD
jgi:hypothetical protein